MSLRLSSRANFVNFATISTIANKDETVTAAIKKLANQGVMTLQPYIPGKPIEELQREMGITDVVKMASNENPLGPSALALKAASDALLRIDRYPDGSGHELKRALAKYLSVSSNQITLGNGSDNVLALITHAFVKPDEEVIISEYAFATFTIITHVANAQPIFAPCKEWKHNLAAMAKLVTDKTKLIFIANPNNPTGTYNTEQELLTLLNNVPPSVIVVVDEAYCEYITQADYPNSLKLLDKFPNLIITRTFSKIYGLAGLRVGYGVSSAEIAEILNRVRLPFNVNSIALAAATAALDDFAHREDSLRVNQYGMEQLTTALKEMRLNYIPSVTNFVTIDVQRNAVQIYHDLLHEGIIVRPLAAYHMPTHIRVTIGLQDQNERFIQALKKVLS